MYVGFKRKKLVTKNLCPDHHELLSHIVVLSAFQSVHSKKITITLKINGRSSVKSYISFMVIKPI